MIMLRRLSVSRPLLLFAMSLAMAAYTVPQATRAQVDQRTAEFALVPGAVVDPDRSLLYMMNPSGGIDAVDISSGERVWHTKQASKPLRVYGDLLIAQAERPRPQADVSVSPGHLDIVMLNARDGGKRHAVEIALPEDTWAYIDDGLGKSLKTNAMIDQGDVIVAWEAESNSVSGVAPTAGAEARRRTAQVDNADRKVSNAVRIEMASRRVSPLGSSAASSLQTIDRVEVPDNQRLADVSGAQYVSADGHHILVSEMIGNDTVWEKYRWTIYSLTGERVGEFKSQFPRAAFFVSGSKLILESAPFSRRLPDGKLLRESLRLQAFDLRTGGELWTRPFRDTAYRGPFPP
jgi:hypothetical protein